MVDAVRGADAVAGDPLDRGGDQVVVGSFSAARKALEITGRFAMIPIAGRAPPVGGVLDRRAEQQAVQQRGNTRRTGHHAREHPLGQPGKQMHDGHDHHGVHQQPAEHVDAGDDTGQAQHRRANGGISKSTFGSTQAGVRW